MLFSLWLIIWPRQAILFPSYEVKHLYFLFWIYANFALLCSYLPYSLPQFLFVSPRREISAHFLRFLGLMLKSRAGPCVLNPNLSDPSFISWGGCQKQGDSVFSDFSSDLLLLCGENLNYRLTLYLWVKSIHLSFSTQKSVPAPRFYWFLLNVSCLNFK